MSQVFVDTSAIYAVLVPQDAKHPAAREYLQELHEKDAELVTSSFVVLETAALLQSRIGMDAVRKFREFVMPALRVIWVEEELFDRALAALLAASNRQISLTDWVSFEIMRAGKITRAFAFDRHFTEQGFEAPNQ